MSSVALISDSRVCDFRVESNPHFRHGLVKIHAWLLLEPPTGDKLLCLPHQFTPSLYIQRRLKAEKQDLVLDQFKFDSGMIIHIKIPFASQK